MFLGDLLTVQSFLKLLRGDTLAWFARVELLSIRAEQETLDQAEAIASQLIPVETGAFTATCVELVRADYVAGPLLESSRKPIDDSK